MTTYTVVSPSGDVIRRNLTAIEALDETLTYDGYAYEIRPAADGQGFDLWHSDGSAASTRSARHLVKTVAFSLKADEAAARQEIAEKIIGANWRGMPEVMTDEQYDELYASE